MRSGRKRLYRVGGFGEGAGEGGGLDECETLELVDPGDLVRHALPNYSLACVG